MNVTNVIFAIHFMFAENGLYVKIILYILHMSYGGNN